MGGIQRFDELTDREQPNALFGRDDEAQQRVWQCVTVAVTTGKRQKPLIAGKAS
jgi:hypothetical protein